MVLAGPLISSPNALMAMDIPHSFHTRSSAIPILFRAVTAKHRHSHLYSHLHSHLYSYLYYVDVTAASGRDPTQGSSKAIGTESIAGAAEVTTSGKAN